MKKVLLIMDRVELIQDLKSVLIEEGFAVIVSMEGQTGLELAVHEDVDLVMMDIMMSKIDLMTVCRKIKKRKLTLPIIVVTSKPKKGEKIMGLELCADDYITEPFSVKELLAKIRVSLRRVDTHTQAKMEDLLDVYTIGKVKINFPRMEASKNNKTVTFSKMEYDLLKYMINRKKEVISRNDIIDIVWGMEAMPITRTVDVFMSRIRKKIEDKPSDPKYIKSIRSAGYKLDV